LAKKSDAEQTPDVKAKADELVGQAREAAALFTRYDQEEVDRIGQITQMDLIVQAAYKTSLREVIIP